MNLLMERVMKVFTIFLFAMILLFAGCDLFPDNDPKMVVGILDPNPEADMSHYEIYWWEGNSNEGWNPTMLQYIDTINHSFTADSIMSDSFQVVLDYVVFGALAVDSEGLKSALAYTRIYSYAEFFAPGMPQNPRVNQ